MVDKPLIINEVDVSTCSERGETISGITCGNGSKIRLADRYIYKYKLCKDNPNCLFKQLARKTQEVEELKKQLTDFMNGEYCANGCAKMQTQYKEYNCKLIKEIDKLKVENEILKKDVERWKGNFNSKVSVIEEIIKIIQQAIKDFSIEYGTPQYDRLLENTKALGIEVKDYE